MCTGFATLVLSGYSRAAHAGRTQPHRFCAAAEKKTSSSTVLAEAGICLCSMPCHFLLCLTSTTGNVLENAWTCIRVDYVYSGCFEDYYLAVFAQFVCSLYFEVVDINMPEIMVGQFRCNEEDHPSGK